MKRREFIALLGGAAVDKLIRALTATKALLKSKQAG
jgi:hypothetical protein